VHRGQCSFTTKANIAEEAGASAILVINNSSGVCMQFFSSFKMHFKTCGVILFPFTNTKF